MLPAAGLDRVSAKSLWLIQPIQTASSFSLGSLPPKLWVERNPGQILLEPLTPLSQKRVFLSVLSIFHLKVDIQLNTVKPYSPEG